TADGAPLDRGIEIVDFPICVRLYGDRFPFSESLPDGADVRFLAGTSGEWLTHEIETWDPKAGLAVIWVRIPILRGNDRQELKLYWGNPNAARRSFKNRVFDASNGFVTVWHFGDEQVDSTGQLEAIDTGTVKIAGPVGSARGFSSGNGINLGTAIEELPEGASPHTTEAWIRVEEPNATILAAPGASPMPQCFISPNT
ncbi:DUF2341 domain-containing protein, partial [bacterium]|nr:DUF2341 domain-containing protein [bacterium]